MPELHGGCRTVYPNNRKLNSNLFSPLNFLNRTNGSKIRAFLSVTSEPSVGGGGGHPTVRKLCDKAVQNTFSCAFPIFFSMFQKLWIFHQEEFCLGHRKLRRPRGNLVLGATKISKNIGLGLRMLRLPKRTSSWRRIQIFLKMLLKIGNAQLNVLCTALLPNKALTQLQRNLFLGEPSKKNCPKLWKKSIIFFISLGHFFLMAPLSSFK